MTPAALRRRFIRDQVRHRLYWIAKSPHDDPMALRFRREVRELRVQFSGLVRLEREASECVREMGNV